jgi:hypothetical protein
MRSLPALSRLLPTGGVRAVSIGGLQSLLICGLLAGCAPPDPDVDRNGIADAADLARIEACRGPVAADPGCRRADANRDGLVDDGDAAFVSEHLGVVSCNGSRALCERRYDEVAYPTSHNAFSILEECCFARNQLVSMPEQMELGIRALMLDSHYHEDGVTEGAFLCHTFCGLGPRLKPLAEGLAEVRAFLEAHPAEVLTLIFEDTIAVEDTRAAFEEAGLLDHVHTQPLGAPWPALRAMVEAGRRLVVFTDRTFPDGPAWYHDWRRYAVETPFSFASPEAFSCSDNRGDPAANLYILNHFITPADSFGVAANEVNQREPLFRRAVACWAETGRFPTFVTVDYANLGSVVEVAAMLNEVRRLGADPAGLAAAGL